MSEVSKAAAHPFVITGPSGVGKGTIVKPLLKADPELWLSVSATNAISDPSAAGTNYLALTNRTQGGIRLYDLDFDQDYAIVVVGLVPMVLLCRSIAKGRSA